MIDPKTIRGGDTITVRFDVCKSPILEYENGSKYIRATMLGRESSPVFLVAPSCIVSVEKREFKVGDRIHHAATPDLVYEVVAPPRTGGGKHRTVAVWSESLGCYHGLNADLLQQYVLIEEKA